MLDFFASGMALQGNHMSEGACYHHHSARDMAILSLLTHAHKLFGEASVIQHLDRLTALFRKSVPNIADLQEIAMDLDPAFFDAFRIATCFENMFKAQLLKYGYVVHIIDKKKQPALEREQRMRPIRIGEIKAVEGANWKRSGEFKIRCLQRRTLTLAQILNTNSRYKNSLRISSRMYVALDQMRSQRNTVHLLVNDIRHFNRDLTESYALLRQLVNSRLISLHESIIARWAHLRSNPTIRLNQI